jgi:hypothetical protein
MTALGPATSGRISVAWLDVAAILACAATFTGWAWAATGTFAFSVFVVSAATWGAFYVTGSLVAGTRIATDLHFDWPLKTLIGYAIVNTGLLLLAFTSPLSIRSDFGLVLAAIALTLAASRRRMHLGTTREALPGLACCILSLAAATFWTQDCLRPTRAYGQFTVFKPWLDGFFHASFIRTLGAAHGAASIEDYQMAFVPAGFYHYASYMTPALLKAFSHLPAYGVYVGSMVPQGTFVTGLAAYALVRSWWGAGPGLAAAAALLLLPDGSHQGSHNRLLSYHFMQVVAPAGAYGVSLLALAWLFMVRGCAARQRAQVLAAWFLAALAVIYKAHLFVANALLLWTFPALFLSGLTLRRRLEWLVLAAGSFCAVITWTNRVPAMPLLRLDGSATKAFLVRLIFPSTRPGLFRDLFGSHLVSEAARPELLFYGSLFLVASIFGAFILAYGALAGRLRSRITLPVLYLPAIFIVNFVVMALGLAFNDRGVGWPEELLHRPFVWPYFLLAAWVGGAAALAGLGARVPLSRTTRALCATAVVVLLGVPATLGRGIQRMWPWSWSETLVPDPLVEAAAFVRAHGDAQDVVQDSRYDPQVVFSALSERRAWAIRSTWAIYHRNPVLERRVDLVEQFRRLGDAEQIRLTARDLRISWFLLQPGDGTSWPESILAHPAFESDGYRLYRFD